MPDDASAAGEGIPNQEFSIVRKGYAPDEVDEVLGEYDVAVRELEEEYDNELLEMDTDDR